MDIPKGKVYLVGAGPGDVGLLTVRGAEILRRADVVVYDSLVNPQLLKMAPQAEKIFVGKISGDHTYTQDQISTLLVDLARTHSVVVRLKGGDPFVFGRGGEECLALRKAQVPYEVVPGVTAGVAAPAYAGIPVTHRGLASSVTFLTGHWATRHSPEEWQRALYQGTLVIYMGKERLPALLSLLLDAGRDPSTPAAVIYWGTYRRQHVVRATLGTLQEKVPESEFQGPALLVVGSVVDLAEHLQWFENLPLYGLRVAVTHSEQRSAGLEPRLTELGATVQTFSTVEVVPLEPAPPFPDLSQYSWLILQSVSAAEAFFHYLHQQGKDARALGGVKLCALGKTTADFLRQHFLSPELTPQNISSAGVVGALASHGTPADMRILVPCSDQSSRIVQALKESGASVDDLPLYSKRPVPVSPKETANLLEFSPHLIVFTNAAAVHGFVEAVGAESLDTLKGKAAFASLGPTTTLAAKEYGLPIHVEPAQHHLSPLIEEICRWWKDRRVP